MYGNEYFKWPSRYRCIHDCIGSRMKLHFGNLADELELSLPYDFVKSKWEAQQRLSPLYFNPE